MTIKKIPFKQLDVQTLYDILNIRLTVFVEEQDIKYVDTDYKDLHADHWLVYEGQKLVSYARVFMPGLIYDVHAIGRVATFKEHRNKGYATALLKEILTHYDAPFKISAQYYLKDYYQSIGFEVVSKMYIEEGIEHIAMTYTPKEK